MNGMCILRVMNGVEVRLEAITTTRGTANPGEMSVSVSFFLLLRECVQCTTRASTHARPLPYDYAYTKVVS